MDTADQKPPRTPKSIPAASYSASSPYSNNIKSEHVKQEEGPYSMNGCDQANDEDSGIKQESQPQSQQQQQQPDCDLPALLPVKRPALPLKEYELELQREESLSDIIYDYQALHHWLNHPVKKFRPSESRMDDPKRPMYRRNSQATLFESEQDCSLLKSEPNALSEQVQQQVQQQIMSASFEPVTNGEVVRHHSGGGGVDMVNSNSDDPYEFNDGTNGDKASARRVRDAS
jgi:hypothetical protein